MKKIAFITMAAFLLFAACKKEPAPEPQPQTDTAPTVSLAGTSWEGSYDDNYQGYPATLMWSIDFLTDSTGTLHLDIVIAANPTVVKTWVTLPCLLTTPPHTPSQRICL